MDKQLLARRKRSEDSFNELVKQKDQKEAEIREIDTELLRLQGEYRLLDELTKKKVSPKAEVLDVDAALEK